MEPLLSNKIAPIEKITLVEAEEIIKTDTENTKVLNNFFSNITKNLNIPQSNQAGPICQNIKDPVIKTIIDPLMPGGNKKVTHT